MQNATYLALYGRPNGSSSSMPLSYIVYKL